MTFRIDPNSFKRQVKRMSKTVVSEYELLKRNGLIKEVTIITPDCDEEIEVAMNVFGTAYYLTYDKNNMPRLYREIPLEGIPREHRPVVEEVNHNILIAFGLIPHENSQEIIQEYHRYFKTIEKNCGIKISGQKP